jgi:hypothetical protein
MLVTWRLRNFSIFFSISEEFVPAEPDSFSGFEVRIRAVDAVIQHISELFCRDTGLEVSTSERD